MALWADNIPKEDLGWQQITLSSNRLTFSNVRSSHDVLPDNIVGTILHASVNGSIKGIANRAYDHTDDEYTWIPCHIFGSGIDAESQVWIAEEAYIINLGDYINIPAAPADDMVFIDLGWLGLPTLHLSRANAAIFAEVFTALANYISAKL